ncbi:MAG TPA: acyl-CoA dehydrogenase family protein [Reyranella sp.]|nr:acyl-CoA dehydrogenase family protein [Reyranella sp.]
MSTRISQKARRTVLRLATGVAPRRDDFDVSKAGVVKRLLIDVRELTPALSARAAEMEASRRIPHDVVKLLKAIGAFRLFVPQSHGGLELDLPGGLSIITALARVDGSVGWTVMIGNGGHLFAALLPRETYDRVYCGGRDTVIAGVSQPAGTAELAEGGWRVNGRWPFASGCLHADWMGGICVMTEAGKRLAGPAGSKGPLLRGFFMPTVDWQIEDTWHAAGLKATASHHIAFRGKLVPAANFFDLANGTPCLPGPLYQTVLEVLPLFVGGFSLGVARGALDELLELAGTGRQQLNAATPMRESETFQYELGRLAADLRAAEAYHQVMVASHWDHALAGTLKDERRLVEATQAGVWIATACLRVVDACFALAGGSAVYETSPLQRRLRDMHVAAQHATIQQRHHAGAGKLLLHPSTR